MFLRLKENKILSVGLKAHGYSHFVHRVFQTLTVNTKRRKRFIERKMAFIALKKMLKCTVFGRKKLITACFSDYSRRFEKLINC